MGVPWLNDAPAAWRTVGLGTGTTPGIAHVTVERSNEVEVKKPKGAAGASTTAQGPNPAQVTIKLTLLRGSELDAWFALADILVPAKDAATPLTIRHPKTSGYRIDSVTVQSISDAAGDEQGDRYVVTIKCVEFRPAPKKKVTKTEKKLEPRNNDLNAGSTKNYIAVERPSRDRKNSAPRK